MSVPLKRLLFLDLVGSMDKCMVGILTQLWHPTLLLQ
jgi:hypothetical protein